MRKFIWTLVLMLCLVGQTALAADFSKLIILHTNDTHGFDQYDEQSNGVAVIKTVKDHFIKEGYDVVLLDAGDAIQDNNLVNFSKGKSAIAFFNAVGYDAQTLGNHEFDYGQDVLLERISEAKYPIVSSNVIVDATGKTLVPPTVIIERPSAKIGVIGLSTPETIVSTSPKNTHGITFLEGKKMFANTQKHVDALKKQGCDLIIGLGHMGSEDSCMGNRSDDVLANVKGIDIFVDGHDHREKNKYVNGKLLVETGNYTRNIGKVTYENGKWKGELIRYGEFTQQDPEVAAIVKYYADEVAAKMSAVVAENKVAMSGEREPGVRTMPMPLGDFVADAFLWQARQANVLKGNVDLAFVNGGGLRKALKAGKVTRGDLVSVTPYNNQIYVMKITGEKLLEIFEAATCTTPDALGSFPHVAGMSYEINTKAPYAKGAQYPNSVFFAPAAPGSRITIKEIGGKPFDPKAVYTVATLEFVVLGGDAYGGLTDPKAKLEMQSIGYVDTEAVENFIREELKGVIGTQYAKEQGRIVVK